MNKVIVYMRVPSSYDDDDVYEASEKMWDFVDLTGAEVVSNYWEMADKPQQQEKLSKAIEDMWDTGAVILTYDLLSLSTGEAMALEICDEINHQGGGVSFVDEESVLLACQVILEHIEDQSEWN